jgi:hypothetical protein
MRISGFPVEARKTPFREVASHNIFCLSNGRVWRRTDESRITLVRGEISMTTIEAVIFGMMLSWTPCFLLMAYFLMRAPPERG